jgi:hypothetical protein
MLVRCGSMGHNRIDLKEPRGCALDTGTSPCGCVSASIVVGVIGVIKPRGALHSGGTTSASGSPSTSERGPIALSRVHGMSMDEDGGDGDCGDVGDGDNGEQDEAHENRKNAGRL